MENKFSPENQALQINTLTLMMEQNTKDHDDIKNSIAGFGKKLDESLERMEERFAGKWVEGIIKFIGVLIFTGFITYLGTLIYQATVHFNK